MRGRWAGGHARRSSSTARAVGSVGSLTLNNTTNETLRVTVSVRPWLQQLDGQVFTDPRSTLTRYVRANRALVHDRAPAPSARQPSHAAPHGQRLAVRQRRHPRQAGQHQGPQGHHPPVPADQLAAPEPVAQEPQAAHRRGARSAAARSCSPSATSATRSTRSAAASAHRPDAAQRQLQARQPRCPGKLVTLGAGATRGLKKGRYTVNATVTQAGRASTRARASRSAESHSRGRSHLRDSPL